MELQIRRGEMADLDAVAALEAICFPPAEAAPKAAFRERLAYYGNHFWLLFLDGRLISLVDGFVTDRKDLTDDMYAHAVHHRENGSWQMIFGVLTLPEYRGRGYAATLIRRMIQDARDQGRLGVVLTCKPEKVSYYRQFGFRDEGISPYSNHGNTRWHQTRITF